MSTELLSPELDSDLQKEDESDEITMKSMVHQSWVQAFKKTITTISKNGSYSRKKSLDDT
jgi:hypothetical protein